MTAKQTLLLDVECYRNYFLLGFRNVVTGNVRQFEMWPDGEGAAGNGFEEACALDIATLKRLFEIYRVISFNGNNYDIPVISAALRGASCAELKIISDKIIKNGLKSWNLGIEPIRCDHIDLFDVAPGMASLKIYGGRLHCKKMQDLPIEPDADITPEQRAQLRLYNGNDLVTTGDLFAFLKPQIELREKMSEVYKIDLRSKSDAQIAEAVIAKEVGNALGMQVKRPEVPAGTRFGYKPPPFIRFEDPEMRELLSLIGRLEFLVTDGGTVQMPDELKKRPIRIGDMRYTMGIGGLHSNEKTATHIAEGDVEISDHDVTSYYPEIIITQNIAPPHLGSAFSRVFTKIKEERVVAKKAGRKDAADSLKIVTNGAGGKLNSKWSKLYFPEGFIHMTLTGQLSLLMLIEAFESAGIRVISANTDGVTVKLRTGQKAKRDALIKAWEAETGFTTEETRYRSVHSRDVNSYLAIKDDGKFKLKGAFAMEALCPALGGGLMTNPSNEVCIEAAAYFLRDRTPIEDTVRNCTDIRRFVTIRQVNGGAVDQGEVSYIDDWVPYEGGSWVRQAWMDEGKAFDRMALAGPEKPPPVRVHGPGRYLGKAVRWYYAKGVEGPLRYKLNGYTVARSEGAKAVMELPDALPEDLDFSWYIRETESLLMDVGVEPASYAVRDLV